MLFNILKRTYLPLISTVLMMVAVGLFNTIVYVEVERLGFGKHMVGFATSLFYLGLLLGSLFIDRYIKKHGYLKTFVSFTVILAVSTEIYDLTVNLYLWLALRIIAGFSLAASFVVVQSWMMSVSSQHERGTSLALYNTLFFGAVTFGQYLFGFTDNLSHTPFLYIAIMIAFSILPLSLTKAEIPQSLKPISLSIIELFKISTTAKITVTMAGVLQAALYGFLPGYCLMRGFDNDDLAKIMAALIFGAMVLQYPLGRLSDKIDRTKTVIWIFIGLIVLSALIIATPKNYYILSFLLFIYGGLVFAIYPIALNILGDRVAKAALTSINQGVLFSNSFGAIVGPLIAPWPIEAFGFSGLFIFNILICAITLATIWLLGKYFNLRDSL